MHKKVLGLDLGTTTLGVAYSDSLGFVHGIETFHFPKNQYIVARKHVHDLLNKYDISEIVIGLPLHLSGESSPMSEVVLRFVEDLKKEDETLIIETLDERYSTVSAHLSINERGMNHTKRKENVDKIAACFILDTYIRKKDAQNG